MCFNQESFLTTEANTESVCLRINHFFEPKTLPNLRYIHVGWIQMPNYFLLFSVVNFRPMIQDLIQSFSVFFSQISQIFNQRGI